MDKNLKIPTLRKVEKQASFVYEIKDIKIISVVVLETSNYVLCVLVVLKVMSDIFLIICFVRLKNNIFETKKNIFKFTSKVLFVLKIFKF